MNQLRSQIKTHPLAASAGVLLIYFLAGRGLTPLFDLLPEGLFTSFLRQIAGILFSFALVVFCGYGRIYRQRGLFKTLLIAMPHLLFFGMLLVLVLISAFSLPDLQWLPACHILLGVLTLFGIGFNEENLFRGIITNLFAEKGLRSRRDILRTVFLSAFLFGATHMVNMHIGVTFSSALFQSIGAFATGALFCAYYLRGGSIWALILLHMLQDASGLFEYLFIADSSMTTAINTMGPSALIPSAALLLITLFLLRRSGCEKIIALRAKQASAA